MRVYAISDLHGFLPEIPDCDLLLLAGDYCPTRNMEQEGRFLRGPFTEWLEKVPARYKVGIAGNHDFILERNPALGKELPWIYLQDEAIEIEDIKIYGTPWTPLFGDWAFMKPDDLLQPIFNTIPEGLDIILSHGPAYNKLDLTRNREHVGSKALANRIKLAKPDSVICGHIHEARGITQDEDTRYYNVSFVNAAYEPKYSPVFIPLKMEK